MSVVVEARKIASDARCVQCGAQVEGAERQVQEHLRRDPSLMSSSVRWVIVCSACVQQGECPCCARLGRTG